MNRREYTGVSYLNKPGRVHSKPAPASVWTLGGFTECLGRRCFYFRSNEWPQAFGLVAMSWLWGGYTERRLFGSGLLKDARCGLAVGVLSSGCSVSVGIVDCWRADQRVFVVSYTQGLKEKADGKSEALPERLFFCLRLDGGFGILFTTSANLAQLGRAAHS